MPQQITIDTKLNLALLCLPSRWPDAGADLSNLGTLHSRDMTLCVFILCILAGAAQNRAVS